MPLFVVSEDLAVPGFKVKLRRMAKRKTPKKKTALKKKRPVKDPCPAYPDWSMARYRGFIRSAMRRAWLRWPPRFAALKAASRKYEGPNVRQKFEYQCAHCERWFTGKQVGVDHIIPWGSLENLTLDEAWSRLLVPVEHLQVLCNPCHNIKSEADKNGLV